MKNNRFKILGLLSIGFLIAGVNISKSNETHNDACCCDKVVNEYNSGIHPAGGEHDVWDPYIKLNQSNLKADSSKFTLTNGNKYILDGDLDLSSSDLSVHGFTIEDGAEVSVCLNGHKIKGAAETVEYDVAKAGTTIFTIGANGTLNLYDCNNEKHYFNEEVIKTDPGYEDCKYWVESNTETENFINGGYLYCSGSEAVVGPLYGGGSATFNFYSGNILGKGFSNNMSGLISFPSGNINVLGGNVVGFYENNNGIYYTYNGNINFKKGEIRNCVELKYGMIVSGSGTLSITGGKIHDNFTNTAVIMGSSATIAGDAEIYNNKSLIFNSTYPEPHGATYIYGNIKLGGSAKVYNNTYQDKTKSDSKAIKRNVILFNNKLIEIINSGDNAITDKASFGFTGLDADYKVAEQIMTGNNDKSYAGNFFSDDSGYKIKNFENNVLKFVPVDSYPVGGKINPKPNSMPEGKPTIEEVTLVEGILDKEINVVIEDKDSLGDLKTVVEENIKSKISQNSNLISQFDIYLEQDGVKVQNIDGNKYRVTLKLPDNYSSLKNSKVIYIKDDGSIEDYQTTIDGSKCTFETTHFSMWGFTAEGSLGPTKPEGGSTLSPGAIVGIVLGSIAGAGLIFFVIFLFFFKKKLTFMSEGKEIDVQKLKWKEKIDYSNDQISSRTWFSDKEMTKPFKEEKMGLFPKKVYGKI